ncbi:MAG: PPC domain-containing protein, partial [Myxococcota bacterium]
MNITPHTLAVLVALLVMSACGEDSSSENAGDTSNGTAATNNSTGATTSSTTGSTTGATTGTDTGSTGTGTGTTGATTGTTTTGTTGPQPECVQDGDCGLGRICESGQCIDGCREDLGCPTNLICEEMACVAGCRDDTPCPEGEICVDTLCLPGCRDSDACGTGRYCNSADNTCVAGCDEDSACGPGRICLANVCTSGCREDATCGQGRICTDNTCVNGCRDNDGCSVGQICVQNSCGPGCRVDAECPDNQQCRMGMCEDPVVTCAPDDLEPNDAPNLATPVDTSGGMFTERTLCPGERDLYVIALDEAVNLNAALAFVRSNGELQLNLLDMEGNRIGESSVLGNTNLLSIAPGVGTWIVEVRGATPSSTNTYRLDIVTDGALPCEEDPREPDDSPATGTRLDDERNALLGVVCPEDSDWFRIPVSNNIRIEAELFFPGELSNLGLTLYDEDGETVLDASQQSNSDTERVSADGDSDGLFLVRVQTQSTQVGAPYELVVNRVDLCDDNFDPNEAPEAAYNLAPGTYNNLRLCPGRTDYYSIFLEDGDTLNVSTASGDPANLDLSILSPDGQVVLNSANTPDSSNETTDVVADGRGLYIIRVQAIEGPDAPAIYTVELDIDPGPIEQDCGDVYEPNNTPSIGFDTLSPTNATICENDLDYYRFEVAAGGTDLRIFGIVNDPSVPVTISILDTDANAVLAQSTPGESPINLSVVARRPGTYFIRVEHGGGARGTSYLVSVTPLAPPDCSEDPYEPNDVFNMAEELVGELSDPILCAEDTDIYRVNISEPFTRLRILTQVADVAPPVVVEVFDPVFNPIEQVDLSQTGGVSN